MQFEPWKSAVAASSAARWDPLIWDGVAQYYPWRLFAHESLRAGVLPLWNPYQFCGTLFIANGQSAVFYPLNLIFWLLPVATALGWSAWLHLVLTGWWAYLFLRRTGTGRIGSVAGAIVWQGNGFFVAWIHLPTVLCTASWLPLILLLTDRALVRGGARLALASGLALGLCYLGGHPQVFLFVAMLTAAYAIARGLSRDVGTTVSARIGRTAVTGAVALGVGIGVACLQLLPTLDLLRIAHRTFTPGPESYQAFLSHSMPALQLGGLLMPHAFGHPALGSYVGRDNYAEFACYVGVVALALALWAPFACRSWHARFSGIALFVVFLIVLGTPLNWPLYRWLPGFARSGGPGRMLVLAVFAMSVLAGTGIGELQRRFSDAKPRWPAAALLLLAACAVGIRAWESIVAPSLAGFRPEIAGLSGTESARAAVLCMAAVALVAIGRRWRHGLAPVGLAVILGIDLLLAAQGHLHITPQSWVYPPITGLAPGPERLLGNAADWPIDRFPNAVLPPNSATVYHLRDAFGYDSLYLARYRDFAAAIEHGDPSPPLNGNMLLARLGEGFENPEAEVYGLDMMSLASVDTVLSPVQLRGLRMERAGAYYTYSNPYARPRAWLADSAVSVPTHQAAVVAMAQLGALPDSIIITATQGPEGDQQQQPAGSPLESRISNLVVSDLSPNAVEVSMTGRGGPYLFLADAYAPGWRAYAGRRELPIMPADVAFRAVALPADTKLVVFRYEPDAFRVGLFVTLLACAALAAAVGAGVRRRQR